MSITRQVALAQYYLEITEQALTGLRRRRLASALGLAALGWFWIWLCWHLIAWACRAMFGAKWLSMLD